MSSGFQSSGFASAACSDGFVVASSHHDSGPGGDSAYADSMDPGADATVQLSADDADSWEAIAELGPTKEQFVKLMHEFRVQHSSESSMDD